MPRAAAASPPPLPPRRQSSVAKGPGTPRVSEVSSGSESGSESGSPRATTPPPGLGRPPVARVQVPAAPKPAPSMNINEWWEKEQTPYKGGIEVDTNGVVINISRLHLPNIGLNIGDTITTVGGRKPASGQTIESMLDELKSSEGNFRISYIEKPFDFQKIEILIKISDANRAAQSAAKAAQEAGEPPLTAANTIVLYWITNHV